MIYSSILKYLVAVMSKNPKYTHMSQWLMHEIRGLYVVSAWLKLLLSGLTGRCCNKPACGGDLMFFSWSVVFMFANCFLSASAILFYWKKMNARMKFAEDPRNGRPPRTKESVSSLPLHCTVVTMWELLPWHSSVDIWSSLIILLFKRCSCGLVEGLAHTVSVCAL